MDHLKAIVDPLEKDDRIAGTGADVLLNNLHLIGDDMNAEVLELTDRPAPAVVDVLDEAANALAEFGRQMAYIYWESNKILLDAVAVGVNAVLANMSDYLATSSLGVATLQNTPEQRSANLESARSVLAKHTSTVAGALPHGMEQISGDLTQPAVWQAASEQITKMIKMELKKMDHEAAAVLTKLSRAYSQASERLKATSDVNRPRQPTMETHKAVVRPMTPDQTRPPKTDPQKAQRK